MFKTRLHLFACGSAIKFLANLNHPTLSDFLEGIHTKDYGAYTLFVHTHSESSLPISRLTTKQVQFLARLPAYTKPLEVFNDGFLSQLFLGFVYTPDTVETSINSIPLQELTT